MEGVDGVEKQNEEIQHENKNDEKIVEENQEDIKPDENQEDIKPDENQEDIKPDENQEDKKPDEYQEDIQPDGDQENIDLPSISEENKNDDTSILEDIEVSSSKGDFILKTDERPKIVEDKEDEEGKEEKVVDNFKQKKAKLTSGEADIEFSPLGPVVSSLLGSVDGEEEEEDEEEERVIEKSEPIDREAYIEQYKILFQKQVYNRRKNSFLSYKLGRFYKKRKMDHVFTESVADEDQFNRYNRRLDEMIILRERGHREQTAELSDIAYMRDLAREQTDQSIRDFALMQSKEKEVAKGLLDTRTGKHISDKQVDRLIARQLGKSRDIADIRLNYIKKKEQIKSLEQHIRTLETIDGKFHLIEYEQLRMDHHNFADKIEERDEDLTKLRVRYFIAVQALTHVREKSSIIDKNIDDLQLDYMSKQHELSWSREDINEFKVIRDKNRVEKLKLRDQYGLLCYTKLLCDMEQCMGEITKIKDEIERLKKEYSMRKIKLLSVRRNIEIAQNIKGNDSASMNTTATKPVRRPTIEFSAPKVHKGRPSLLLPRLSSSQFQKTRNKYDILFTNKKNNKTHF